MHEFTTIAETKVRTTGVRLPFKADFQSVELSMRAEILLFAGENVALILNRQLRLSNLLLSKIPPA